MGALLVPLTVMVFFWEMNVPRNISILDVISVFFVGGVFSLVVTLFLFEFFPSAGAGPLWGSTLVGLVEELGKVLVVAYYVKKNNTRYKLNGLLLGSCVGAGFAVFETAGYAFRFLINTNSLAKTGRPRLCPLLYGLAREGASLLHIYPEPTACLYPYLLPICADVLPGSA